MCGVLVAGMSRPLDNSRSVKLLGTGWQGEPPSKCSDSLDPLLSVMLVQYCTLLSGDYNFSEVI